MVKERRIRHEITSTLAIFMLFGAPTIAHALSCGARHFTLNEAYEAADSIIVGLMTECKKEISSDPWANGGSDCSFSSIEVLKESTPARDYNGITSSAACGLSLHVGGQYLLFLDSKNQPMYFSATLSGDRYQAQLANKYIRIIRDFRNGVVNDLAEPWRFVETDWDCSISQRIGGNGITFSRRTDYAPQQPKRIWTQDTINGYTVYRANVTSYNTESQLPGRNVEIVSFGEVPDYTDDVLVLRVSLAERSPAPVRQATLSVGVRTWPLNRYEMNLSLPGGTEHKVVFYLGAGDVAEEILSAMAQPSDIVVSAMLVAPNIAAELPEVPLLDQGSFGLLAPTNDVYLGQAPPDGLSTRPSATSTARATGSYGVEGKPPEPWLRIESRSTQLSREIQNFNACFGGNE